MKNGECWLNVKHKEIQGYVKYFGKKPEHELIAAQGYFLMLKGRFRYRLT